MQENKDLLFHIILIAAGLFSIIASALDWDFFFESRKARFFTAVFGRNGSRIFYTILGGAIVVLGMLLMAGIIK